jgi:hypothetical protein
VSNYAVNASADDETVGDGATTTGTAMVAKFLNSLGGVYAYGRALIDTSAIGTDTISAATFYWYHNSYTKTKAASFHRRIKLGTYLGGTSILDSTATPPAAGWHSEALTSGELSLINKTGDTEVIFDVDDPGGTYDRLWQIAAWDYVPTGTRACYLAVTHAAAGGPTKFSILR